MGFTSVGAWPLWFVCAAMVASAVIDWWKFKVPNKLTFPVILSGWALGLLHTSGLHPDVGQGGIGDALAGTAMGFACLIPMYAVGGMGAGDVKMTMGFGSWVGAYFGLAGGALWHILYAFCVGALVGGVIALGMIAVRRQFRQNLQHTRAILMDFMVSGSLRAIATQANQRRPRWHRLPYGVPLCIGFLGYLFVAQPGLPTAAPAGGEALVHSQPAAPAADQVAGS